MDFFKRIRLLPGPEANNADCDDEGLVDGDCQHTDEVIDDVPDDDDIDLVSSLSVIPNEILSHIITPNTRIRFDNVGYHQSCVKSIQRLCNCRFDQPVAAIAHLGTFSRGIEIAS